MSKTIVQIFDELTDDLKQEVYRIVGWSVEHSKVHPVIKQYNNGENGKNLYAVKEWHWFGKLTEEQRMCIAAIVEQAAGDKED